MCLLAAPHPHIFTAFGDYDNKHLVWYQSTKQLSINIIDLFNTENTKMPTFLFSVHRCGNLLTSDHGTSNENENIQTFIIAPPKDTNSDVCKSVGGSYQNKSRSCGINILEIRPVDTFATGAGW